MPSYLDILQQGQIAAAASNPFESMMRGAQGFSQIQNQLLAQRQAQQDYEHSAAMNPLLMQSRQAELQGQQIRNQAAQMEIDDATKMRHLGNLYRASQALKPYVESGDFQGMARIAAKMADFGLPDDAVAEVQRLVQIGDADTIRGHINTIESLAAQDLLGDKPAEVRAFEEMTKGMTPEQKAEAREVWAGIRARAGESAQERIARTGKTGEIAQSEAQIAGAKAGAAEEAQLGAQSRLLPDIRAQIKRAESEATSQGETVTALTRAKAALPGLLEVSDKLKKLADVATYTTTGKLVDLAAKELGFGSTKGGTARATMTSIVDNQVLPLLRDTFGAAFTVAEGDRLRDSLLDPDASPDAKKATLDAFIDQKYRNIEMQERELGISSTPNQPARIRFDAQGNQIK